MMLLLIIIVLSMLSTLLVIITYIFERKMKKLMLRLNVLQKNIDLLKLVYIKSKEAMSKPSKIRKRYIVFAILSSSDFNIDKTTIEKSIRLYWEKFFGRISLVKADPQLIYFDPSIKRGVLRVAHIYKDEALAVLGIIKKINNYNCLLIPLKTTGTLKKARKIMYSLRKDLQK
ncbi:ribonuclease P protein subunit Rpp14 [Staphylothermus marinus F1]|uniref:Ribonuclease P protein component 2 n=1 Tax=Staphylothermus marinus (strain ATCC 43588 / DSM 3639 / JCM 9404 / F1) TaxID=399550 RepID=A3DMU5_STAMF|nr:Rpp14/Pop5 family protein [Staphylothermus marinus]ABN69955.1 ribonuclease P protein subunit Rpp14 [Staphylothermus marinus F1]